MLALLQGLPSTNGESLKPIAAGANQGVTKRKENLEWPDGNTSISPMPTRRLRHCIPPHIKRDSTNSEKEGWELVSVVFDQTGHVQKLYFKRETKTGS
jgi:hypothetical protein